MKELKNIVFLILILILKISNAQDDFTVLNLIVKDRSTNYYEFHGYSPRDVLRDITMDVYKGIKKDSNIIGKWNYDSLGRVTHFENFQYPYGKMFFDVSYLNQEKIIYGSVIEKRSKESSYSYFSYDNRNRLLNIRFLSLTKHKNGCFKSYATKSDNRYDFSYPTKGVVVVRDSAYAHSDTFLLKNKNFVKSNSFIDKYDSLGNLVSRKILKYRGSSFTGAQFGSINKELSFSYDDELLQEIVEDDLESGKQRVYSIVYNSNKLITEIKFDGVLLYTFIYGLHAPTTLPK